MVAGEEDRGLSRLLRLRGRTRGADRSLRCADRGRPDGRTAHLPLLPAGREGEDGARPVYDWRIFGGNRGAPPVPNDLRRYIWVAYLQALRDAQGDLASWNRSPLLLSTSKQPPRPPPLRSLRRRGEGDCGRSGQNHRPRPGQGTRGGDHRPNILDGWRTSRAGERRARCCPLEPMRLIRSLRIFVDGEAHRPLGSASLGTLNVLYCGTARTRAGTAAEGSRNRARADGD